MDKLLQRAKAYTTALFQDVGNKIWNECKRPDETIGEALGESAINVSESLLAPRDRADNAEKEYCEKTRKRFLFGVKTGFNRKVDRSLGK